jgi:hypothetical protein
MLDTEILPTTVAIPAEPCYPITAAKWVAGSRCAAAIHPFEKTKHRLQCQPVDVAAFSETTVG